MKNINSLEKQLENELLSDNENDLIFRDKEDQSFNEHRNAVKKGNLFAKKSSENVQSSSDSAHNYQIE